MTPKRPKALKWTGDNLPDGRPIRFINDVEPRDYDEDETDALTQDQLQSARSSGLYREVPQSESKSKKQPKKKVDAPDEPDETVAVEPADDAAEPAQEGEDG